MIDEKKLIEELGMLYRTPIEDDETVEWNRAIYKAIEYTESQPPADQWIPCKTCDKRCDKWENSEI